MPGRGPDATRGAQPGVRASIPFRFSFMQSQFASIPQFWQGVFASILATVIVGVSVKLYQRQRAQQQQSNEAYKQLVSAVQAKLTSPDPLSRIEGYLVALFSLMSYLFLGNLVWLLASLLASVLSAFWPIAVMLYAISLVMFAVGLNWILSTTKMTKQP
jgi:hypothetical protein